MAQPLGLDSGEIYSDGGIDYQVVRVISDGVYSVTLIGISSVILNFSDLSSATSEIATVVDSNNVEFEGMWIDSQGNYELQVYRYLPE